MQNGSKMLDGLNGNIGCFSVQLERRMQWQALVLNETTEL